MATFVLVHGAWHGGWCWDKVVPLLQAAGDTAVALDLPGHGADKTSIAEVTLQAYADRVCDVLAEQPEPAILVGHSMGGMVISQAAEQCPERVRTLVFLTAGLIPGGQRLGDAGLTDGESELPGYLRLNEAGGYMTIADEGIKPAFYHDCSDQDVAFARARLVPQAIAPVQTPLTLSEERFGRVPRVYIECLQDRAISPATQRRLYTAMPCARVLSLDTSHSPFFSAPEQLAEQLASLA